MNSTSPLRTKVAEVYGFVFSFAAYFMLDKLYVVYSKNYWAGIFGKANNSAWEQTKIVIFAFLFVALMESVFLKLPFVCVFVAKTAGMIFCSVAVPCLLYGYSGAFGFENLNINKALCIFCLLFAYCISCKVMLTKRDNKRFLTSLVVFAFVLSCSITLTAFAPDIPLFRDERTGAYGMDKHLIYVSNNTMYT